MNVRWVDLSIIVCYFIGVVLFGLWISRRKIKGGEDYFLASRQMSWPFVGASLFSTNISAQQFVGQAGAAFVGGIAVGTFQMMGALCFALLAIFFLDTYRGLRLCTSPEFFERRYNASSRAFVSLVNMVMVMLCTVAPALYAGAQVSLTLLDLPPEGGMLWVGIITLGVVTGSYTLLGGLRAVIYMDFVQNFVLILGGAITLVVGIHEIGGLSEAFGMRLADGTTSWALVNPINHHFGWLPVITGVLILGVHAHCTDQDYIQRALSAKNTYHAKMGAVFAGVLKVVALFICAVPGVVAARLFQERGMVLAEIHQDQAYVRMMMSVLPTGLLGVCLAGLLAAIMSSVDSGLCASSSLLTFDFIMKGKRGEAHEATKLRLGRWIIVGLLIFAIFWAPYIMKFPGLFDYLMLMWSLMAPPVFVCVMCGLFYQRANGKGATATLAVGIVLGLVAFFVLRTPEVKEHLHWYFQNEFNVGFMIMLICLAVMVSVSHLTGQTEADARKARAVVSARQSLVDDMTVKEKIIYRCTLFGLAVLWIATVVFFSPWGIAK